MNIPPQKESYQRNITLDKSTMAALACNGVTKPEIVNSVIRHYVDSHVYMAAELAKWSQRCNDIFDVGFNLARELKEGATAQEAFNLYLERQEKNQKVLPFKTKKCSTEKDTVGLTA